MKLLPGRVTAEKSRCSLYVRSVIFSIDVLKWTAWPPVLNLYPNLRLKMLKVFVSISPNEALFRYCGKAHSASG